MADKTENKIRLSKRDRWDVCWRSTFLQGSWNYERMQNGGYAYAMIPAIKKLYKNKDDQAAALKRHWNSSTRTLIWPRRLLGLPWRWKKTRLMGPLLMTLLFQGLRSV